MCRGVSRFTNCRKHLVPRQHGISPKPPFLSLSMWIIRTFACKRASEKVRANRAVTASLKYTMVKFHDVFEMIRSTITSICVSVCLKENHKDMQGANAENQKC